MLTATTEAPVKEEAMASLVSAVLVSTVKTELPDNSRGCVEGTCIYSMEEHQCECFQGYTERRCNVLFPNCSGVLPGGWLRK